jgi:hypothetical protein
LIGWVALKKNRTAAGRERATNRVGPLALFLGAGASKPFGFPVTDEILPEVLSRLRRGDLFPRGEGRGPREADESARDLGELLERLLPGLFAERVVAPLITDVFSLLDQIIGTGGALGEGADAADLVRLRSLLEHAVAEVLSEPRGVRGRAGAALQERLASWIHRTCAGGRFVSVISTNYDFGLERSLLSRIPARALPGAVDFGLTWRPAEGVGARGRRQAWPRPARPRMAVLKLHGALNWLRCPLCEHVVIHPSQPIFREGQGPLADSWLTCSCGFAPLRHVLVAPSMVRDVRDPNLLSLWQSALEALRAAEEWVIVGYSLPPQDVEIRAMLLRAYRARPQPPRVRVVQAGRSRETEHRYRVMFPDMTFDEGGVEGFVRRLPGTRASARTSRAARAARRS